MEGAEGVGQAIHAGEYDAARVCGGGGMRESIEIWARRETNLIVRQRWRFVAVPAGTGRGDVDAALVAWSPPFWSSAGVVYDGDRERAALRELLHRLALDGWQPWGTADLSPRGRSWYAHRLYRDTPSPTARRPRRPRPAD